MSSGQELDKNWTLALSASESHDLHALGFFEGEDKRFLRAILTPLVYQGARIAYGGRIEPHSATNFTQEISTQLAEAYRRSDSKPGSRPYVHYLRDNDARREGIEKFLRHAIKLGSYSEIKLLRGKRTVATLLPSGQIVDVCVNGHPVGAVRTADELMQKDGIAEIFGDPTGQDELADMRSAMAEETNARIIVGGRVTGLVGGTSGVAAEALVTLSCNKPLIVVGGIGGASRDVASELGLIDNQAKVERDEAVYKDSKDQPSDGRYWDHMKLIQAHSEAYRHVLEEKNVLEDAKRLAISESHAEIGSLIVTMLSALLPGGDNANIERTSSPE